MTRGVLFPRMSRVAFITGITGQDGSWLADLLLERGYTVHGLVRRPDGLASGRAAHLAGHPRVVVHPGCVEDADALTGALDRSGAEEFYHLAAQSSAALSLSEPVDTCRGIVAGTLHLLDWVRTRRPGARLFLAGSSEVFGTPATSPQNEWTPFRPVTPYGCAKAFAADLARVYRERYGVFVVTGILFNHESERRGPGFVTAKICRAAAEIRAGRQARLALGRLEARRDWSDARDVLRGMWLSLQAAAADDYVFASGVTHSVEDVVSLAFDEAGLDWRSVVDVEPGLVRGADPVNACGDASKASRVLGWRAETSFEALIRRMTRHELGRA